MQIRSDGRKSCQRFNFLCEHTSIGKRQVVGGADGDEKDRGGKRLAMSFADATKAYFIARPTRDIFIRPPKELNLPPGTVGLLLRCAYGTRDAGALWEEHYATVLKDMGSVRWKAGPTCFHHPTWHVAAVVHGDDFVALGTDDALEMYEAGLRKAFE